MASALSAQHGRGPLDVRGIIATSVAVWPRLMLAFGPIYTLQVLPDVLPGQMSLPLDAGGAVGTGLFISFAADLFGLLISIVCLGALTAVATQVLDGGQPRIMASIDVGLRRFFPVVGACGFAGLIVLFGFILLIVPGFILTTWYFLVVPVCVLEGLAPGASLTRSAALSKGERRGIFTLFVVIVLAGIAAAGVTYVGEAVIGGLGAAIVDVLAGTAVGIFAGTVPVVTYRALTARRVLQEQ